MTDLELYELVRENDIRLTIGSCRDKGMCTRGLKIFLEGHGFVWREVIYNGLLASQLLAIEDSMADDLVRKHFEELV